MTDDEKRVRDAYLDAAVAIAQVVGHPDWEVRPSVDTEKLPALVMHAGHGAIEFLAVAIGQLDPDEDPEPMDPDEFLRRLTERQERPR